MAARERLLTQILIYSFVLFAGCMVCHGELAHLKPDPRYLTLFYMCVATGGVLGGIFVGLAAPYLFSRYWEYQLSLLFAAFLAFFVLLRDRNSWVYSKRAKSPLVLLGIAALLPESAALATDFKTVLATWPPVAVIVIALVLLSAKQKPAGGPRRSMIIASCAMVLLMLGVTLFTLSKAPRGKVAAVRNFYGALTVDHQHQGDPALDAYALEHGEVLHGFEFTAPDQRLVPTSYYAEKSGLGLTFANWDRVPSSLPMPSRSLRIGVIGLGIGTTAAYALTGDYIRFYEINPAVVQLASDTRYFHYLQACPASFDIVLGDARLSLERELAQGAPQNFDVLVVDAFSGDAIPVHLLTEQAFRLYFEHLKGPTGVLAVHVSNSLLNLRPVVAAAAHKLQVANVWVHVDGDEKVYKTSDWVLLCRDRGILDSIAAKSKHASELHVPDNRLWTDDYSNLFQALELHP